MATDIYIERSGAAINKLRREVFNLTSEDYGSCFSLTGLNSTGKTTLIRHLAEELKRKSPPNVYYFCRDIEGGYSFWTFWASLILDFSRVIRKEQLEAAPNPDPYIIEELLETYAFFKNTPDPAADFGNATNYLNNLFDNYTQLGIHIILVLDEFDRAAEVFRDTQFYDRLFSLSPKSNPPLRLSIVTVSRRSYDTIAVQTPDGSDPREAFPQLALRGFSNKELDLYFDSYGLLPGAEKRGLPDEKTRQAILYFGGRSPAVLMNIRKAFAEMDRYDLDTIDFPETYKTVYDRLCKLLSTEFADRSIGISCMTVFLEWFFGPRHSQLLPQYMDHLVRHGYINRTLFNDSLYVRSGLEEESAKNDTVYESISPYFEDYLVHYYRNGDLKFCSNLLEDTERAVRRVIASSLKEKYGVAWESELLLNNPQQENQKVAYLNHLISLAEQTDFPAQDLSKLSVMAWPNYATVIRGHWDLFSQRFMPLTTADLEECFTFLKSCRDCSGHHNMEVLNQSMRERLKKECAFLLSCCDPSRTPLSALMEEAEPKPAYAQILEENIVPTEEAPLLGSTVVLVETSRGSRGNLRGYIQETDIRVSLPKIRLDATGTSAAQLAGKIVQARLLNWDQNAGAYLGELVEVAKQL